MKAATKTVGWVKARTAEGEQQCNQRTVRRNSYSPVGWNRETSQRIGEDGGGTDRIERISNGFSHDLSQLEKQQRC